METLGGDIGFREIEAVGSGEHFPTGPAVVLFETDGVIASSGADGERDTR